MTRPYPTRTASFVITLVGVLTNSLIASQIFGLWQSIKWEPESEWESSSDKWVLNGFTIAWAVLLAYFSSAVVVCLIGLAGVVKSKSSLVKFYRDYSIADFSFCALFTLFAAYSASLPSTPVGLCEGVSRQPELMRDLDLAEMGLTSENCERWFKRSVMAFLAFMVLVLVARLHFILAISIYYSHLFRHYPGRIPLSSTHHGHSHSHSYSHSRSSTRSRKSTDTLQMQMPMQKVYLLPRTITELQPSSLPVSPVSSTSPGGEEEIVMYAPVPLSKLPKEVASKLKMAAITMEGWMKTAPGSSSSSSSAPSPTSSPTDRTPRHRHHRSHSTRDVMTGSGEINLPITPDEGLFDHLKEEKV